MHNRMLSLIHMAICLAIGCTFSYFIGGRIGAITGVIIAIAANRLVPNPNPYAAIIREKLESMIKQLPPTVQASFIFSVLLILLLGIIIAGLIAGTAIPHAVVIGTVTGYLSVTAGIFAAMKKFVL